MIGLLRWPFEQIGAWIEGLVSPAPQVQLGVAGAVDEQEQRKRAAFFESAVKTAGVVQTIEGCVERDPRCPSLCLSCEHVSAAADAAGTGPGAPATPSPAPGQPDRSDQVVSVSAVLQQHRCMWFHGICGGRSAIWSCNGCEWEGDSTADHDRHLAELVVDMLRTDARMAAATNKFRQ